MDTVAWWAISAPEARRVRCSWLCQKGTATRKCAGRVKVAVRRRDKKVPRVKEVDRAKTHWTPVRSRKLLLCPSKACKPFARNGKGVIGLFDHPQGLL
jgi:hypothetical protein